MADIVLSSAFDSDDFWAARSGGAILTDAGEYRFQNTAGFYVKVTDPGASLTYTGGDPAAGGTYTQVRVYSDAGFATEVASYSSAAGVDFGTYFSDFANAALGGADRFTGSSGNDAIHGHGGTDLIVGAGGADTLDGGAGSDTYRFDTGDFAPGEAIADTGSGVGDIDTIEIDSTTDFTLPGTITGIDAVTFTAASQFVYFESSQLPSNLLVTGANGTQGVNVTMDSTTFDGSGWAFANWIAVEDAISVFDMSGSDTITGTGQRDLIHAGDAADIVDGGDGSDEYVISVAHAGFVINDTGASGIDMIAVISPSLDFTSLAPFAGIEALMLTGIGPSAIFNAGQLPTSLAVSGLNSGAETLTINNAASFSAGAWTFSEWEATDTIVINGDNGNDAITGSSQHDLISGGSGDDSLAGGLGDDVLDGGGDTDTANYQGGAGVTVSLASNVQQDTVGAGLDTLTGIENLIGSAAGADKLTGNGAANLLSGLGGNDRLVGGSGKDSLLGGSGKDTLTGGVGRDIMTGGTAHDVFDFNLAGETGKTAATRDRITDFKHAIDDIDLKTIDANGNAPGNGAFIFLAAKGAAFTGARGELHWFQQNHPGTAHDRTIVEGDVNGDRHADFQIELAGLKLLSAGDFLL